MTEPDISEAPPPADAQRSRPLGLTLVCLMGWLLLAVGALRIAARWDALEKLPPARAGAAMATLLLLFLALAGYWRMRRWGLWLLALLLVARLGASAVGALPLQPADVGLPVVLLVVGAMYWKRLG